MKHSERPLRFGVQAAIAQQAPDAPPSGAAWTELAQRIESQGYGTLCMPDHVIGGSFAPLPALAAAAAVTTSLRLGTLVIDNDFRNPLMLAREMLTLDVLSAGRVELGIGAGWLERDYTALGMPYDTPGTRIDRLDEALTLMHRLFKEDEVTFEGRFYSMKDAKALPKAVQRPHPPILVAGGGRKLLGVAARHADIVQFTPKVGPAGQFDGQEMTHAALDAKIARVREVAGERFDELELSALVFDTIVTDDRATSVHEIAQRREVDDSVISETPHFLIGTLDEIRAQLLFVRERFGITYFSVRGKHVDAFAPLARELSAS